MGSGLQNMYEKIISDEFYFYQPIVESLLTGAQRKLKDATYHQHITNIPKALPNKLYNIR